MIALKNDTWINMGTGAVFGAILLESFGIPAPGEATLIVGSLLASQGYLSIFSVVEAAWMAAVVGDNIGYAIGLRGGRRLVLRFKSITANSTVAVLLSAAIFSLGHGYEGSAGVVTVGVMGLVFAFVYMWRQSLVAPIVMHFLQDFISIVLLPLFGKG